jgi:hypothetical protein
MTAGTATIVSIDPVFDDVGANAMLRLRDAFGPYGMYSNEGHTTGYADELPQRLDAIRNHLRRRADVSVREAAARTNYLRETYAYGDTIAAAGIEPFLLHEGFADAARRIHGGSIVEPAIVFANLYLPGQELAVHTDVPEFRGANRTQTPQWLLVAMHHSGLFERWHMPIATAIAFFGPGESGALITYPNGREGERVDVAPTHNTAVVIDADSVFHGVDRVVGDETAALAARPGMHVRPGTDRWMLLDGEGRDVAEVDPTEIRFSVSWKAYCFADAAQREAWRAHADDLSLEFILDTIERDLRDRGLLTEARPEPSDLAPLIIDTYTRFPT